MAVSSEARGLKNVGVGDDRLEGMTQVVGGVANEAVAFPGQCLGLGTARLGQPFFFEFPTGELFEVATVEVAEENDGGKNHCDLEEQEA